MNLQPLVRFYRKLAANAAIRNSVLTATAPIDLELVRLISEVKNDSSLGRFRDIEIDGEDYTDEPLDISVEGFNSIRIEFLLSTGNSSRFYSNFDEFVSNNSSLNRGGIPAEFYLINEDCFSGDDENVYLKAISNFSQFVICLSELAHYHDSKSSDNVFKLVFIHPEDGGGKRAVEIKVDADSEVVMLAKDIDISLLHSLCKYDQKTDMHYYEKLNIFAVSLIDEISRESDNDKKFFYLVKNWSCFLEAFDKNISTYMSGFAFHKAKRDVAEAEINLTEKLSKLISDITTRVLSIPLSFAAIIALLKAESFWQSFFIVIGILMASIIISQLVDNQQRQLKRVSSSIDMIVNAFVGKQDEYPADLKVYLEDMKTELEVYESKVKNTLRFFRALSWLPVLVAVFIFVLTYTDWLA